MKRAIQNFWRNLLTKLNDKINQWLNGDKPQSKETRVDNFDVVNPLVMILKKLLNYCFMQCDFELTTDSSVAEPLVDLCEDLQKNCYKIGAFMLGGSDTPGNISECWAVPCLETVGGQQKLFHSYIGGDRIIITGIKADRITECYMILDATKRNDKIYLLCRKHMLDDKGNLTISYFVSDETTNETSASIPEWDSLIKNEITYPSVNHIGFGRYKSPVLALDGDDTYGKAINHGCGKIEAEIQTCFEQIQEEFAHKGVKIFADEKIVRTHDKDGNPIKVNAIDEYIYPVKSLAGVTPSSLITEFSPAIRESSYYAHLTELLKQYEALCGLNNILTHDTTNSATATEIRMMNSDNIALIDNIRQAVRKGNIETLEADSIYLGIPLNQKLWEYDETWQPLFEDEQQTLENNIRLYEQGASELKDLVKYWFSTLTDKEIDEKIERIKAEKTSSAKSSLESMLNL